MLYGIIYRVISDTVDISGDADANGDMRAVLPRCLLQP